MLCRAPLPMPFRFCSAQGHSSSMADAKPAALLDVLQCCAQQQRNSNCTLWRIVRCWPLACLHAASPPPVATQQQPLLVPQLVQYSRAVGAVEVIGAGQER
eukprot:TRINITY_DN24389_c1_g1_i1.p3 TRINITY_DN24389_c1_g1~~TRINITY_DN24389_c1_g1_i1.p3  ORF type:complete len:101 (-),score=2.67 TRINITY_DN24389_c1_g1_i1:1122-1424(-)